ncbi:hypothetical protein M3Y99_00860200 [Aphelenchoides fujianensis]|nr:hypothetical protein M3Y99_00860200 [Aphelenchoides fujianensis]
MSGEGAKRAKPTELSNKIAQQSSGDKNPEPPPSKAKPVEWDLSQEPGPSNFVPPGKKAMAIKTIQPFRGPKSSSSKASSKLHSKASSKHSLKPPSKPKKFVDKVECLEMSDPQPNGATTYTFKRLDDGIILNISHTLVAKSGRLFVREALKHGLKKHCNLELEYRPTGAVIRDLDKDDSKQPAGPKAPVPVLPKDAEAASEPTSEPTERKEENALTILEDLLEDEKRNSGAQSDALVTADDLAKLNKIRVMGKLKRTSQRSSAAFGSPPAKRVAVGSSGNETPSNTPTMELPTNHSPVVPSNPPVQPNYEMLSNGQARKALQDRLRTLQSARPSFPKARSQNGTSSRSTPAASIKSQREALKPKSKAMRKGSLDEGGLPRDLSNRIDAITGLKEVDPPESADKSPDQRRSPLLDSIRRREPLNRLRTQSTGSNKSK